MNYKKSRTIAYVAIFFFVVLLNKILELDGLKQFMFGSLGIYLAETFLFFFSLSQEKRKIKRKHINDFLIISLFILFVSILTVFLLNIEGVDRILFILSLQVFSLIILEFKNKACNGE